MTDLTTDDLRAVGERVRESTHQVMADIRRTVADVRKEGGRRLFRIGANQRVRGPRVDVPPQVSAGDYTFMTTILQRFHRTGRIAEVRLQADGLFVACMFPAESEAARSVARVPDIPTLARARVVADDKAHADCDGDQCGRWELTSVAKADSRVLHVLYPVTIDDSGRFHKVGRCPKGHHVDANFAPAAWLAGLSEGTLSFYCIECGVFAPPSTADRDAVFKALRHCGF